MNDREQAFAHFDELGEARVEALVLTFNWDMQPYAFEWLQARRDAERASNAASLARSEASQSAQLRMARIAAIAAVIAVPLAAMAAIPQMKEIAGVIMHLIHR